MDDIKFSLFDIFAYIIPGSIILFAAVILVDGSIVRLIDLGQLFQNISLSTGLVIIVVAYIVGFAFDTPASILYYSIARKAWGPIYHTEKGNAAELSNAKKRALVREFSPQNDTYIQLWKVIKTMSHNLSFAALIVAIVSIVKSVQSSPSGKAEWIVASIMCVLLGVVFLQRAHVFDKWHYKDLSETVQALHLEKRALKEVETEPGKTS